MVILFSSRHSKIEAEITEILQKHGANRISDKLVLENDGKLTLISVYKKTEISVKKGIAVFLEENERFANQKLPKGILGICQENNKTALKAMKNSNIPVITCGANHKNTVSLSSISDIGFQATVQRSITNINGKIIDPGEYNLKLSKKYSLFAVMVSFCILLIYGITPSNF